jgi:hypothetical protein
MNTARFATAIALCAVFAGCGTTSMPGDDAATGNDSAVVTDSATGNDAAAADGAVTDPFAAPPGCTSGTMWTRGNRGSDDMNPGQACIACHNVSRGAPRFTIAGTVYRTGHEPDNCNGGGGTGGAAMVEITDAMGQVIMIPVSNFSGNFDSTTAITPPYRARVVVNGVARVMNSPQTNGDCNVCHTQAGTMGAPGRIALP